MKQLRGSRLTLLCSVYADSSSDPLDDPKVETIVELLHRIWVGNTTSVSAKCDLLMSL
jgi:hypothetical protein